MTRCNLTSSDEQCRDCHGFWLAQGGPDGGWWLYLPAGVDPSDGLPLTHARKATPTEVFWWERGQVERLKIWLRSLGFHLPAEAKRSRWKRLVELFRRRK